MLQNRKFRLAAAMVLAATATSIGQGQNAPVGGGFANPVPGGGGAAAAPGARPKPTPYTLSGAYTLSGKTEKSKATTFTSNAKDVSAIYVKSLGDLTVTDAAITTTGDSSSEDNSNFYGLNAVVLASHGSKIKMVGGSITSAGTGANGVFATGPGASISLSKTTISTLADGAHGAMASAGGSVSLADVTITTTGARAGGIATDRGGGTITMTGGTVTTSGDKSPAIYSTGNIKVATATMTANAAEAAVIEGSNSISLTDTTLTGTKLRGVMIYQSTSGDSQGGTGNFSMKGGNLNASDGPMFYVTNTNASITVSGVTFNQSSSTLIDASPGEWGRAGSNGGHVIFTADNETLNGDLKVGAASSIAAKLQNNTTLNGTIKGAALAMDSTSTWNVSGDATVTVLIDSQGINGRTVHNITGNGHDVIYDSTLSANQSLGSRTYNLASGGHLVPSVKRNGNNNNGTNNGMNNGTDNGNNNGTNNGTNNGNNGNNGGGGRGRR
jgi:hypothetical protein